MLSLKTCLSYFSKCNALLGPAWYYLFNPVNMGISSYQSRHSYMEILIASREETRQIDLLENYTGIPTETGEAICSFLRFIQENRLK